MKKIFAILNASYNFCPATWTTVFDKAQIKALKTCESFKNKPYIVPCLFHYSQAILKKFKYLNIIKKKLDKHSYELLRNLEILCFIKPQKIENYYEYLKGNLFISDQEKEFMDYFKKVWIIKYKEAFNYYGLIDDIKKLEKNYINKKGNTDSEKKLISILKSLNKVP